MFTRPSDRFSGPRTAPDKKAHSGSSTRARLCEFCKDPTALNVNYSSDTDYHMHMQIKHRKEIAALFRRNENMCRTCLKRAPSRDRLINHVKTSHLFCDSDETSIRRDIFVCDLCKRIFFSKLMVAFHLYQTHKFKTPRCIVQCPKCEKSVLYASSFLHFSGHTMNSVHACPICFLKFHRRRDLRTHMRGYHALSYKCNMCSYESNKRANLTAHVVKLHPKRSSEGLNIEVVRKCFVEARDAKPTKHLAPLATRGVTLHGVANLCVLCREICASQEEMLDHFATVHTSSKAQDLKKKYLCSCGEVFFNAVLLKHHVFKLKAPHRVLQEGEEVVVMEWLPEECGDATVDRIGEDSDEEVEQIGEDSKIVDRIGEDIEIVEDSEIGKDGVIAEEIGEHSEVVEQIGEDGGEKVEQIGEGSEIVELIGEKSDEDFRTGDGVQENSDQSGDEEIVVELVKNLVNGDVECVLTTMHKKKYGLNST